MRIRRREACHGVDAEWHGAFGGGNESEFIQQRGGGERVAFDLRRRPYEDEKLGVRIHYLNRPSGSNWHPYDNQARAADGIREAAEWQVRHRIKTVKLKPMSRLISVSVIPRSRRTGADEQIQNLPVNERRRCKRRGESRRCTRPRWWMGRPVLFPPVRL